MRTTAEPMGAVAPNVASDHTTARSTAFTNTSTPSASSNVVENIQLVDRHGESHLEDYREEMKSVWESLIGTFGHPKTVTETVTEERTATKDKTIITEKTITAEQPTATHETTMTKTVEVGSSTETSSTSENGRPKDSDFGGFFNHNNGFNVHTHNHLHFDKEDNLVTEDLPQQPPTGTTTHPPTTLSSAATPSNAPPGVCFPITVFLKSVL